MTGGNKMKLKIEIALIILSLIFLSGCTAGSRIDGKIIIEQRNIESRSSEDMSIDLSYMSYLPTTELQEYRLNLFVNGRYLTIYKDGNVISKENAEVITFSKEKPNIILNYTIQASSVYSGEYVETITAYISTNKGIVKTITSDFITITSD